MYLLKSALFYVLLSVHHAYNEFDSFNDGFASGELDGNFDGDFDGDFDGSNYYSPEEFASEDLSGYGFPYADSNVALGPGGAQGSAQKDLYQGAMNAQQYPPSERDFIRRPAMTQNTYPTDSVMPVARDVNPAPAPPRGLVRTRLPGNSLRQGQVPTAVVPPDSAEDGEDVEDLQKLEEQCFFKSDLTTVYRVTDFNLFATAAIKSRGYLLRFAVYPVGITSSSDSSIVALLSTQSAGGAVDLFTRKVPEVLFLKNTLKIKVKFTESTAASSELIADRALVRNQWSLVTISVTGGRLLLEVINSKDTTQSFGQEAPLSFRRDAVSSAFIYGGLLPAANAFIAQLDICAREAIIGDGEEETVPTMQPTVAITLGPTSAPTNDGANGGGGGGGIFNPPGDIDTPIGGPIFGDGNRGGISSGKW